MEDCLKITSISAKGEAPIFGINKLGVHVQAEADVSGRQEDSRQKYLSPEYGHYCHQ